MRPLVVSLFTFAGLISCSATAGAVEHHVVRHISKNDASASVRAASPVTRCLGGVLNADPAANYLALGDYPAQAAATVGGRVIICGDKTPPFIRWTNYRSALGAGGVGGNFRHGR